MTNINNLFIRIVELNLTAKKVSDATGISTGNLSDWKNGKCLPSADKLATLADYLDCSVDYLLGRTTNETNSHNTISGNNNIIGNGNNTGENLTKQEIELLNIFDKLDAVKQAKLLVYASELKSEKSE